MSAQGAIRAYGATAVYRAACAALDGDYTQLGGLGIEASTLGEAWRIQSSAYKAMTPSERAEEQMAVNGGLMRIDRR